MSTADMTKTQEIPIPETIADICREDPEGVFTYRRMDCRDTDSTSYVESWKARKPAGDFTEEGE
jgi:hypothetical protein